MRVPSLAGICVDELLTDAERHAGVISIGLRMSNAIASEEGSAFTLLHELEGDNTETGICTGAYVYRVDRDTPSP